MCVTRETNHNSGVHSPIFGNLSSSRYRAAAPDPRPELRFPSLLSCVLRCVSHFAGFCEPYKMSLYVK